MWELDYKESWVQKNWWFWTVVLEKTLESPLDCKEIQPVHPKGGQSWVFIGMTDVEAKTNTLATWCKELTHLKRPWCWEGLGAGGEGDSRGWDGWMASPTQCTWVWVGSGSWWWTGRLSWHAAIHEVAKSQTRLSNWTELNFSIKSAFSLTFANSVETHHLEALHHIKWGLLSHVSSSVLGQLIF